MLVGKSGVGGECLLQLGLKFTFTDSISVSFVCHPFKFFPEASQMVGQLIAQEAPPGGFLPDRQQRATSAIVTSDLPSTFHVSGSGVFLT